VRTVTSDAAISHQPTTAARCELEFDRADVTQRTIALARRLLATTLARPTVPTTFAHIASESEWGQKR